MPRYQLQASPGPLIILVRHGKTVANEGAPVARAWRDYPLDESKKHEIQLLANKLKPYNPQYLMSSDLVRDTDTSHVIGTMLGIPKNETDFRARTWDIGDYEGKPLKDINCAIEGLYRRPWERPPGSTESFNEFSRRWLELLDSKIELASVDAFRPAIIVTHGKNIALAYTYLMGGQPEDALMPLPANFAVISVEPDGQLTIEMNSKTEPVIEDV